MCKTVFLDRDGIINRRAAPHQYITRWEDFRFLAGVPEAIRALNEAGYQVFVVTSQRGVARGMMTMETVEDIHRRMCRALEKAGAHIDDIYYEAAEIDGAGFWKKLTKITLPLLKPSLTVSTVLNIIYVFNSFPIIWTITKGDPADKTHTLATYLYKLAFTNGRMGQAAAVSVVGFVILCICAGVYMVLSLKAEKEDQL